MKCKLLAAAMAVGLSTVGWSQWAHAAPINPNASFPSVAGGGGANWISIGNFGGGAGFGIADASIGGQSDAYDIGGNLQVGGTTYVAPNPSDLTGNLYTGGVASVNGLNTSLQYFFDNASPIVRSLATFTNPGGAAVTRTITWQNNLGADASTQVTGSSSGDTTFGINDRWVTTDDVNTGAGDPATYFALYGPGALVPTSATFLTTTFLAAGAQGVRAEYMLTVGAGQTVSLLFFNGIDTTTANALAAVTQFDNLSATDPLLAGVDLSQVANWDIAQIPEPGTLGILGLGLVGLGLARRKRAA